MFKYLLQSVNHNNGFSGFWCFAIKIYISEARKLTQHVCLSRRLKFSSQEFTVLSLLFQGIRHPLLTSRGTRGHTKYTHPCKPDTQIQNTSLQKYNTHSNGQLRTPLPQLVMCRSKRSRFQPLAKSCPAFKRSSGGCDQTHSHSCFPTCQELGFSPHLCQKIDKSKGNAHRVLAWLGDTLGDTHL